MPIKKLELDNLHPANPLNDVARNINDNLDAIAEIINNINSGIAVVGSQGPKGDPGPEGRLGPPGPQGERGEKGDKGDQGEPGPQGPAGKDGKDGIQGASGPQGGCGEQGIQGLPGKDGRDGVDGKDGAPGKDGRDGINGINGKDGLPGAQGIQGPQGVPGSVGPKGDTGPQGPQGPAGAQGPKGDPGGTTGFNIPQTANTASWVNLGTWTTTNTGTTLYMRIVAHSGYNAEFAQNQLTEVYFKTSNGTSNVNGFYGDGSASRNSVLGGNGAAPGTIRVVQNSLTSYTFYGWFGVWSNGSHYTYSTDSTSSWAHSGTTVAAPTGTFIDITPTVSDIKSASGYVDAGTFVTLDNIRATVTTTGNRGLSVAAVAGSFQATISATFGFVNGNGGNATTSAVTYNTTPSGSWFGYHFPNAGDGSVYLVNDVTNNRFYRITLMIGASYLKNFVSIERLA